MARTSLQHCCTSALEDHFDQRPDDAAAYLRGDGIDDGLGASGFVGGPHRATCRVVRDPVRIIPGAACPITAPVSS